MNKLVGFEFQKVFLNRFFIILLCLLYVGNLFLFCNRQYSRYGYVIEAREEYEKQERELSDSNPSLSLSKTENTYNKFSALYEFAYMKNDEEWLRQKMEDTPELVEEYQQDYAEHVEELEHMCVASAELYEQAGHVEGYQRYLEKIGEESVKMSKVSIFAKAGSFSSKNLVKTAKDFEKLKGITLTLGLSKGITAFSHFKITDFLIVFLVFYISMKLFWQEREKGLLLLVHSTKNGRVKCAASKILLGLCGCIGLTLIFYGTNLLAAGQIYGFGDMGRYIQSMREFGGSNVLLTVGEYFGVFLWGKVLAVFHLFLMISLFLSFAKNIGMAFLGICTSFGVSFLAYYTIPALSRLNALKYLNPVAFFDIFQLVAKYYNINFVGIPVDRPTAVLVTQGVTLVLFTGSLVVLFLRGRETEKILKQSFLKGRYFRGSVSLTEHEIWKLFISGKMFVVPLLLAILINHNFMTEEPKWSYDEMIYAEYMESLSGELTAEKEKFILEERKQFEGLSQKMAELTQDYENGLIEKGEYDYQKYCMEGFSKKETAFSWVEQQYGNVLRLQKQNIYTGLVNKLTTDYLFSEKSRDIANALFIMIVVIMSVSISYGQDYKTGMIAVLNPTKKGKKQLFIKKVQIAAGMSFLSMVLYIPQYRNAYLYYPHIDIRISLSSITAFSNVTGKISIGEFFLLNHILQLVAILLTVMVTTFIIVKLRSQMMTMLVSSVLLFLPLMLSWMQVAYVEYFSFAAPFLCFSLYGLKNGGAFIFVNLLVCGILAVMCYEAARRDFCNFGKNRKEW